MDIKYRNPITGEFDKIVLDNMIKIKTNPDEVIPNDTLTVYDIVGKDLQVLINGELVKFTNAYTDEDKEKVESLPELVQQITESNKSYTDSQVEGLESTIPTKTSELENDSDYATKEYVEQEIANFDFIKIVTELPETGLINRTYFVPKIDAETNDLYDEYMWVNDKWELIGTKQIKVDLSEYAKLTDIKVENVKVNGTSVIKDKIAEILVPTKTSELQNDSGYITANDVSPEIQIGGEEPTDSNIILWFDENDSGYIIQYPDGDNIKYGTEVINNE